MRLAHFSLALAALLPAFSKTTPCVSRTRSPEHRFESAAGAAFAGARFDELERGTGEQQ